MNQPTLSSLIWAIADLLRGDYKQSDYGKVILPFTMLRRLDCVLAPTKDTLLAEFSRLQKSGVDPELFLQRKSGHKFYNTSPLDMKKLMDDQDHIKENLFNYIQNFSASIRDIFERFEFASIELSIPAVIITGIVFFMSSSIICFLISFCRSGYFSELI